MLFFLYNTSLPQYVAQQVKEIKTVWLCVCVCVCVRACVRACVCRAGGGGGGE